MPTNDNWIVTIARDPERRSEDIWIATAKRSDFEFTQKVAGNEGEITAFCKTARTMFKQHEIDKGHAAELSVHFDEILEQEDKREADEAAQEAAKALADAEAKAKAEADAEQAAKESEVAAAQAATDAARAAEPIPAPVDPTPVESIQDAPKPEEPKNETPL